MKVASDNGPTFTAPEETAEQAFRRGYELGVQHALHFRRCGPKRKREWLLRIADWRSDRDWPTGTVPMTPSNKGATHDHLWLYGLR